MKKSFLIWAAGLMTSAVCFGALGTHFLREKIPASSLVGYEAAVRYQIYHGLALLCLAIIAAKYPHKLVNLSGYLMITGTLLFSGSIYLLSTRSLTGLEHTSILGPLTPIGGICLVTAWILLLIFAIRKQPL